jgi:hypothetical protein
LRREHRRQLYARVTYPTAAAGRSASSLGVMRALCTLISIALVAASGPASPTDSQVAAAIPFAVLGTGSVPDLHPHEAPLTPPKLMLPALLLAHDEAELRRLWEEFHLQSVHGAAQSVPTVDFARSIVVLFFGVYGSNCNPYRVARVLDGLNKVTFVVIHGRPGKNCMCASSVYEPYVVATIPRTAKPIELEIDPETYACG